MRRHRASAGTGERKDKVSTEGTHTVLSKGRNIVAQAEVNAAERAMIDGAWRVWCSEHESKVEEGALAAIAYIPSRGWHASPNRIAHEVRSEFEDSMRSMVINETTLKALAEVIEEAARNDANALGLRAASRGDQSRLTKGPGRIEALFTDTSTAIPTGWKANLVQVRNCADIGREGWNRVLKGPPWLARLVIEVAPAKAVDAMDVSTLIAWLALREAAQENIARGEAPEQRTLMRVIKQWPFPNITPPLALMWAWAQIEGEEVSETLWAAGMERSERTRAREHFASRPERESRAKAGTTATPSGDPATYVDALKQHAKDIRMELKRNWNGIGAGRNRRLMKKMTRRWRVHPALKGWQVRHHPAKLLAHESTELVWKIAYASPRRLDRGREKNGSMAEEMKRNEGMLLAMGMGEENGGRTPKCWISRENPLEGEALANAVTDIRRRSGSVDL